MLTPQRNHDAMSPWHVVLVALAGWLNREQQKIIEYLKEGNRVLREQLGTKRLRFNDEQRRRLAVKGKELGVKVLRELGCIVTPYTILRWYRELITMKYDGSEQRSPGRPSKPEELRALVIRMAQENPGWGYTRIRDALGNLGHEISRGTVQAILKHQGIDPAPERSPAGRAFADSFAHPPKSVVKHSGRVFVHYAIKFRTSRGPHHGD
jgi:putative transposase